MWTPSLDETAPNPGLLVRNGVLRSLGGSPPNDAEVLELEPEHLGDHLSIPAKDSTGDDVCLGCHLWRVEPGEGVGETY